MKELNKLAPFLKHFKGYTYFKESVRLAQKNELALTAVIKEIYLPIAIKHHTSYNCVERDIRTFCKHVWENGGQEAAKSFGISAAERVPANRKCIELAATVLNEDKTSELCEGLFGKKQELSQDGNSQSEEEQKDQKGSKFENLKDHKD